MKTEIVKKEGNMVTLEVIVAAEEVIGDYRKMVNKYKGMVNVPGFRKGKAPLKMVEQLYGDHFKEEFRMSKSDDYFKQALRESGLNPVSEADLENVEWQPEQDFVATYKFEVLPEIEQVKYEGLEAEFEAVEYTDSLLEEALKQIQKQFATQEEVESVAEGDLVKIAATRSRPEGAADMEPLQIEREITVGENQYGKELNENLLGKQVGAIISGRLFDESEEEEEVKLREAEFEIEIKEIKRTLLPEINDEFAKDAGFENVQELKETIAKDKKLEIEKHNRNLKVQAMEKALHDANPVEFPATVVKDYALNLAEDWAKQYNLEPEKLLPMFMPIAEFQMRVYFLKHQLIEELEIKAEEADKENLIREAAEHLNIEVEEYKKLYAKQIASPEFESKVKEEKIDNLIMEKISFIKPQPQSAEQAEEEE